MEKGGSRGYNELMYHFSPLYRMRSASSFACQWSLGIGSYYGGDRGEEDAAAHTAQATPYNCRGGGEFQERNDATLDSANHVDEKEIKQATGGRGGGCRYRVGEGSRCRAPRSPGSIGECARRNAAVGVANEDGQGPRRSESRKWAGGQDTPQILPQAPMPVLEYFILKVITGIADKDIGAIRSPGDRCRASHEAAHA